MLGLGWDRPLTLSGLTPDQHAYFYCMGEAVCSILILAEDIANKIHVALDRSSK